MCRCVAANQSIVVEMDAGSGDVTTAGGGQQAAAASQQSQQQDHNDDDDDDEGRVRPHHFDKNIYTFSASAGRALQQQQSDNIKNLVYVHVTRVSK